MIAGSLSLVLVAVAALVVGYVTGLPASGPSSSTAAEAETPTPRPAPNALPAPASVDTFDRAARSLDDPNSIWVVVNKLRPMNPQDFEPPDLVEVPVEYTNEPLLRQEASDAVVGDVRRRAATRPASSWRRTAPTARTRRRRTSTTATTSPPRGPGFSEHQTGLAIDIGPLSGECSLDECFADTPEGIWLRDNAWRFGFILRYPADKTDITGYTFEPWHFRYVGADLANEMHETGVTTLEEFFGLPPAPDYG